MAFKNLIAFGAGEITPELYERGNLDKFRTGLKTLRNATVTKMGGIKSRAGTIKLFETELSAEAKFLWLQHKGWLCIFTTQLLTIYTDFDPETNTFTGTGIQIDLSSYPVADDISTIHLTYNNDAIFLFNDSIGAIKIQLFNSVVDTSVSLIQDNTDPYDPWTAASAFGCVAGPTAPTGYMVQYVTTFVYRGVETGIKFANNSRLKPVGTNQHNVMTISITKASLAAGVLPPDEIRVYQRPMLTSGAYASGDFMYVGSAPISSETATTLYYTFIDYGVTPDPLNNPPKFPALYDLDTLAGYNPSGSSSFYDIITAKTGLVYQDRLVFSGTIKKNRVHATRIGSLAMTRDFPMQDDSALSFATGSDGALTVNRFFDGRGLLIFTNVGVYESPSELLTPDTAFAIKRGPYVAEESIEPVQLGGNVTIYDRRLKSVIGLVPNGNDGGYGYTEFSIYSNHLLKGKQIVSWALQDAETQILWMVLDDGTVLSFSYQDEQMVRSWARHDFQDGLAEEVFVMKLSDGKDIVCFCVNRNGDRYVERMADRDALFLDYVATDSTVVIKENVMQSGAVITATVAPVVPTVWDGSLTITPSSGGFDPSHVGKTLRFFTDTYEYIDFDVTSEALGVLTVTPSSEFPSDMALITLTQGIWMTYNTLTGLSHLEGKEVSVRVDGFTHASPLNTVDDFESYTVTGGEITLADGAIGSHITVGLPIVMDIETLEVDTVEQSPTKLEDKIVNKVWLSYYESLFLFAAAAYPDDNTVTGMENQAYQVEPDEGILFSIPPLPQSERLEMQIQGDWKTKGSIALRNVDPQPIALRAIIPDIEVIRN